MAKTGLALIAALLAGFTVFCGCAGDADGNAGKTGNNVKYSGEISVVGDVDMERNFSDSMVRVTITREARFLKEEYKPDDFSEVLLDRVEELLPGTWSVVLQQLEAERTGDWSGLEERIKSGMLVNLENFERILYLTLAEPGKENVVTAVKLLGQRADVQNVSPYYIPWPQPPGSFPSLGAETELQVKHDYLKYLEYLEGREMSHLTVDDIRFDDYFGTYNGCVVILFLGDAAVVSGTSVAGYKFSFPTSAVILVWKQDGFPENGHFCGLGKAYDLGLLTEADIKSVHGLYTANREGK